MFSRWGCINCVFNGLIQREKIFKNIWIQPAAGDAWFNWINACSPYALKKKKSFNKNDKMNGSYLGFSYFLNSIKSELEKIGAHFKILEKKKMLNQLQK